MKHVSLLKKLGLGLTTVAAVTPLVAMTSCGNDVAIKTDILTFENFASDWSLEHMKSLALSKEDVVLGTKKYCEGNYFLTVGSNTFDNACIFFANDKDIKERSLWYGESLTSSIWYRTMAKATAIENVKKNFGFVNYIDFFDFNVYAKDGHLLVVTEDSTKFPSQNISPFKKWTTGMIAQTKIYNREKLGYEWDETTVSTSDYIRQDDSAKAYRELCQYGAKMFPTNDKRKTTFDVADGSTKTLTFFYKDGKLTEVFDTPTTITETSNNKIYDLIKTNFVEKKE